MIGKNIVYFERTGKENTEDIIDIVAKRLEEGKTPEDIISEMYIRCFSRKPAGEEVSSLIAIVAEQENKKEALEDIFWSLLNSSEFLFNH